MKRIAFLSALSVIALITNGQIIKYQSESYLIEKPRLFSESLSYFSEHVFDLTNMVVTYTKLNDSGGKSKESEVRKYSIKKISEKPLYYDLKIKSNMVRKIFLPKGSGDKIEYFLSNGIHWVFYDLKIQK